MTRKDYQLIADAMRNASTPAALVQRDADCYRQQHTKDCHALADALARDNPRFDRGSFLAACEVDA